MPENWYIGMSYKPTCGGIARRLSSVFCRVRKTAKGDYLLRQVRQSVRPSAWKNSAPTRPIVMKLDIPLFFESLWRKFKFH